MEKSVLHYVLNGIVKGHGKMSLKSKQAQPLEPVEVDFCKGATADKFTIGFHKEIMLPDDIDKKKYYIAGYGENNPARGVIDPQYAHAVWIDDNTQRGGVLLISLDPGGLVGKESVCNAGDPGAISGSERSLKEGNGWLPTPVLLPYCKTAAQGVYIRSPSTQLGVNWDWGPL